jgi:hypothetical protein
MYLLQYSDTSIIPKSNTKRPISSWIFGEVLPKSLKVWVRCDNFKAIHIKMHVHTSNLNTGSHWFTLNKFSAPCYCMYSFNIVRHHIIPKFNTKRPIASWLFFVKCCQKVWKFVWCVIISKPFTLKCMCTLQTWTLVLPDHCRKSFISYLVTSHNLCPFPLDFS